MTEATEDTWWSLSALWRKPAQAQARCSPTGFWRGCPGSRQARMNWPTNVRAETARMPPGNRWPCARARQADLVLAGWTGR